jgi:HK97 family phage prohead protease
VTAKPAVTAVKYGPSSRAISLRIIGYGSVFNSRSEPSGVSGDHQAGAFDDVLVTMCGLFNHDPNFILGRSTSGTLAIAVDDKGLRYDITAPETPTIRRSCARAYATW